MRKNIRQILVFAIVMSMMLLGTGCDMFIKTNDGKVDLKWYMEMTYEDANGNDHPYNTTTGGQVAAVALEEGYSEYYGIVKDEDAFINIETIKGNIDDRFYWDKNDNLLMFTDAKNIYKIEIGTNKLTGETDEELDYEAAFEEAENCYVNMKFVARFIDLKYQIGKENGDIPSRISISYVSGNKTYMTTNKKIEMRTKGDYQNLIVTTLDKDTKVTVINSGTNWNKVKTEDGFIGYVPVKKLKDEETKEVTYKNDLDEYTHVTLEKKVSLVWNQVYNQTANGNFDRLMEKVSGVNVISPTWFSLSDKKGNLSTLADYEYVEKAHNSGLQVWALVNDFTDKKLTQKVLTTTSTRQALVNNIMYFMDSYDLDGINIDFEYISEEIVDSYLQFLRELSVECRKVKKVLSIDNYVPSEWSQYYDRKQQALLADYLIIMNYDEIGRAHV